LPRKRVATFYASRQDVVVGDGDTMIQYDTRYELAATPLLLKIIEPVIAVAATTY